MVILSISVFILLISVMVYFYIHDKNELKRYEEEKEKRDEEFHRYVHDPEYRKKKDKEFEDSLKPYNSNYHVNNDHYCTTNYNHTTYTSRYNESSNDITSLYCHYGMWSLD